MDVSCLNKTEDDDEYAISYRVESSFAYGSPADLFHLRILFQGADNDDESQLWLERKRERLFQ